MATGGSSWYTDKQLLSTDRMPCSADQYLLAQWDGLDGSRGGSLVQRYFPAFFLEGKWTPRPLLFFPGRLVQCCAFSVTWLLVEVERGGVP